MSSEFTEARRARAHRMSVSEHDVLEAHRDLVRAQMARLTKRLRDGTSINRVEDTRALDAFWGEVKQWP